MALPEAFSLALDLILSFDETSLTQRLTCTTLVHRIYDTLEGLKWQASMKEIKPLNKAGRFRGIWIVSHNVWTPNLVLSPTTYKSVLNKPKCPGFSADLLHWLVACNTTSSNSK